MDLLWQRPLEIEIKFDGEESRQIVDTKLPTKDTRQLAPLFDENETVKGTVTIRPRDGRRVDHLGVKIQFIGAIELNNEKGHNNEFNSWAKELASPGDIRHIETYPFEFRNIEKRYPSYNGVNARLRYYVRVTVFRRMNDVVRERDLWVYNYEKEAAPEKLVKVDVGIEDCLHIEFEYNKSKYHLKDVIIGRIYFLLIRLKLRHMELSLLRRETVGSQPNQITENETVVKFEIMDGAPVKGETIPIRLFLGGYDLVPTMRDVNKKFSCQNYLSLLLIDDQNRRYYKQTEIVLYRRDETECSPEAPTPDSLESPKQSVVRPSQPMKAPESIGPRLSAASDTAVSA